MKLEEEDEVNLIQNACIVMVIYDQFSQTICSYSIRSIDFHMI